MTVLPFLAITFGAAAASLLLRANARMAAAIGIAGLLAAAAAAARIRPEDTLAIGGSELAGSDYLRLFALVGSLVALALTVLGLASTSHRNAPGVLLAGMGSAVLALALTDARIGVLAATAGGLFGVLVTIASPATPRSVVVASRELRALAVAGVLAILATAWIGRPLGGLAVVPEVFGFAYLGFAAAVAIRFGAIPFHFWAARLADAAPEVTLPMLMAWGPAAFAIVALTWADQSVAPLAPAADRRADRDRRGRRSERGPRDGRGLDPGRPRARRRLHDHRRRRDRDPGPGRAEPRGVVAGPRVDPRLRHGPQRVRRVGRRDARRVPDAADLGAGRLGGPGAAPRGRARR